MAIVFAILLLPVMLAIGGAIDYVNVMRARTALDSAADASALAAAEFAAAQYRANNNRWESAGVTAGQKTFAASIPKRGDISLSHRNVSISVRGQQILATVEYSGTVKTKLLGLVRIPHMNVGNTMTSSVTLAKFTDLHIVIDNSESMGMAASAADEMTIQTKLGTTCFLACHLPGNDTLASYRGAGATLRIDVIKAAVVKSLTALQASSAPGTLRIAVYTFNNNLTRVFPLSASIPAAIAAVNAVDLATDGGGTNITYSLNSLNAMLGTPGKGANAGSPAGSVLLFTDAVQDHEQYRPATGWTNDPNWVPYSPSVYNMWDYQPIDPGGCAPIKAKGYSMFVLNAQYVITSTDLAEQSRYGDIQNVVLPAVPANIQSCSSGAGYFYIANSPAEIVTAVTNIFTSAANTTPRLTN
ncbi:MAG: vWA domain-containing protein [Beijerinckiaceae bacterium]